MINLNKQERLTELEKKAKDEYIENSNWDEVINMLDEDEKKEYNRLLAEYNMENM